VQVVKLIQDLCKSPLDKVAAEVEKLTCKKGFGSEVFFITTGRSYQSGRGMKIAEARAMILAYVKLPAVRTWAARGCLPAGRPAALAVAAAPGLGAAAPGLGAAAPGLGAAAPGLGVGEGASASSAVDEDEDEDEDPDTDEDADEDAQSRAPKRRKGLDSIFFCKGL
jgi:hypothetical protein